MLGKPPLNFPMSTDALFAFSLFAFVTAVTPGPNNLMVLASGVNFGLRASLPHLAGICVGFFAMLLAVGLGMAEIFTHYPAGYAGMRWMGAAYLLYLAWHIARADAPTDDATLQGQPWGFWAAAVFQWVNPKAWVMAIGAFGAYVPTASGVGRILGIALLFAFITAPSIGIWAVFGARMRRYLAVARFRRVFNYSMAALLVASLAPLLETA